MAADAAPGLPLLQCQRLLTGRSCAPSRPLPRRFYPAGLALPAKRVCCQPASRPLLRRRPAGERRAGRTGAGWPAAGARAPLAGLPLAGLLLGCCCCQYMPPLRRSPRHAAARACHTSAPLSTPRHPSPLHPPADLQRGRHHGQPCGAGREAAHRGGRWVGRVGGASTHLLQPWLLSNSINHETFSTRLCPRPCRPRCPRRDRQPAVRVCGAGGA